MASSRGATLATPFPGVLGGEGGPARLGSRLPRPATAAPEQRLFPGPSHPRRRTHRRPQAKTHEKVDSLGENRSIACHAVVMLLRGA